MQESLADYNPQQTLLPAIPADLKAMFEKHENGQTSPDEEDGGALLERPIVNPSVYDLQTKYPDVLGWLTLDQTTIDYPFVQSLDNLDYLRTDLDGNYSEAGTIFSDCRCHISSSFVTILYGHNLEDNTMFCDLDKFADSEFWAENTSGKLYLPRETYRMQIMAYLVINAADEEIYAPEIHTESEIADFQSYIAQNARKYRATDLTLRDKVLILSTCNYEYTGARSVLVIKLISETPNVSNPLPTPPRW